MKQYFLIGLLIVICLEAGELSFSIQKIQQRWPWNGKVDIYYTITYDDQNANIYVHFIGKDGSENRSFPLKTLEGDGADGIVKAGTHRVTWDMSVDEPNLHTGDFSVTIQAFTGSFPYMVIDLSGGTDAENYAVRYSEIPPDITKDDCRTTELWLRLILPGTFMMGSPLEERGRDGGEILHKVTLTKPFYIGIFEITQRQYQLIMGTNPSKYRGNTRPVESVSYNVLRGNVNGASWPVSNQVDDGSFIYVLRKRTSMLFDLPTEAQWEYACRASTNTAFNSGKNLKNLKSGEIDAIITEIGRYSNNRSDGKGGYSQHTKVGSYLPNAWGLYDMHGNVHEWRLDWYGCLSLDDAIDHLDAQSGSCRLYRGGCWSGDSFWGRWDYCRSASRYERGERGFEASNSDYGLGFRLVYLPIVR